MAGSGKVYLIGAGPGDEGLLTLRGDSILKRAEVVVFDRLVNRRILARANASAELIFVGKNAGAHPIPQEQINRILLEKALVGKLVVRLKGGDPFLFGRGGEELELLCENNIPFEVVPGVTSAIAAGAYAGIPVTHRDYCSSLHIITGHKKRDGALDINYTALVELGATLVFMMSIASIAEVTMGLLGAGMPRDMPSAVVENGTLPNQRKLLGTLENIAALVSENAITSPAIIYVGKVCALSERFDFYNKLPLKGCKILTTRPTNAAGKLHELLYENGAEVIELPCITTKKIAFSTDVTAFDVLVFSSAVGVESFFAQLESDKLDSRALAGKVVAAVGKVTAKALQEKGILADFLPEKSDGEALGAGLIAGGFVAKGTRVGLFRARVSGEELPRILRSAGAVVEDIATYETAIAVENCGGKCDFDYVTFTSASCVEGFKSAFANEDCADIKAVCIGDKTAKAARAFGMKVHVSQEVSIESMVEKLKELHHE